MRERQTRQKRIIYEALTALDHPTATEVYGYVHERYPSVSRATVFRVLGGFADTGKALEVRMAGTDVRYDYNVRKHCHVHCRVCGRVADVPMPENLPIAAPFENADGFRIEDCSVEFFGLCPDCARKSELVSRIPS